MNFNLFKYSIGAIFGLAAIISIVLNTLVISAVIKDPLKRLRKMFNFLLIHLCMCDLAASFVCFPMTSYASLAFDDQKLFRTLNLVSYIGTPILNAGFFTTICLSYDRYKAITDPIVYRGNISTKHFLYYIGIVWVLALMTITLFFLDKLTTLIVNTVMSFVVTVGLTIIYNRVWNALKTRGNGKTQSIVSASSNQNAENEKRALSTCKLILLTQLTVIFFLMVTDFSIRIYYAKHTFQPSLSMRFLFNLPMPVAAIVNPIICITRMKDFRDSIKAMFRATSNEYNFTRIKDFRDLIRASTTIYENERFSRLNQSYVSSDIKRRQLLTGSRKQKLK
eukprot:TCONS_00048804-protein